MEQNFTVNRTSKLVRTEMLRACAKLLKRSIFDGKACDADTLDQTVHFLLTNEDPQLVSVFVLLV